MAAELPKPGVEVIQVFRTVTPTVVTPTLLPCIVGACKQTVDVLVTSAAGSSALNTNAYINLPGGFIAKAGVGATPVYAGLDGLDLVLSINNGPDVTTTFVGASLSPSSIVAQLLAQFLADGVTEGSAAVYGSDSLRVFTIGVGEFQSISVQAGSDPAVLSAFDLKVGEVYTGATSYAQDRQVVTLADFPDPNNNIDQLSVESATVRAFLGLGSGVNLRELSRTSAFLRKGGGGAAASVLGTVDLSSLTYPGDVTGLTLIVSVDDATAITVALGTPADEVELLQKINAALGAMIATDDTPGLRLTSTTTGTSSAVEVTGGTAKAVLGFTTANDTAAGVAGVSVVDDGNGDLVSPLVKLLGEDFTTAGAVATCTGLVDLTTLTLPGDLLGLTLMLGVSGKAPQSYTFTSAETTPALVVTALNGFFGTDLVASLSSNKLVLTTAALGADGVVEVLGGTSVGVLGLVPSVLGSLDIGTVAPDATALNAKKLKISTEVGSVEITFSGLTNVSTPANIVTFINAQPAFSALAVASLETNELRLRSKTGGFTGGVEAFLSISAASSAEVAQYLGFNIGQRGTFYRFDGPGHVPISGDDLYVDGDLVGRITQVAPGGVVTTLKIDKQLTIDAIYGDFFWINGKNLSTGSSTRPEPELVVDGFGVPTLKHDVLRDINGNTQPLSRAGVYLAYRALRLDVSAKATNPGLLSFSNTTDLESRIAPISTSNPLALGVYFALLNAPGATVSALGIDAVTADAPFGTVEAFTRGAEYLEAFEVYGIAPLTHDETVAQVFSTHVTAMSEPAAKGERVVLFNLASPTKKLDTLVASGLTGNTSGSGGLTFDTGVVNLGALLLAQGVNPIGTLLTTAGVFLDIASDAKHYSIASISGSVVTIRKVFSGSDNDDGFYSTTDLNDSPLTSQLINEAFSVKVRGASLTNTDGSPNLQGRAETYQALAQTFANRRFRNFVPESCAATINGLEQIIDGFYMCAARAGMMGQNPPQQSFTNFPMTGFTRVIGSNGYFTEKQLNIIAAGGNDIIVQEVAGAPLASRFALTTDMTSIETRTDSVNSVVDFTAKFLRKGVKSYIGRFNITQGFLDSLSHVIQGLLDFLKDLGVLIGASLNNLIQDENAPDTVIMDITLDVPYPCNFIRITLVV